MLLVLTYHSIASSDWAVAVTPENFRRQLEYLKKRGFLFVHAREIKNLLKEGAHRDHQYACITFDDGVEDNFTTAFPILKKLGIPASIFVTTGSVGLVRTDGRVVRFMSWEQMREMRESGFIEIENHTHSHGDLRGMSSSEIEEDVRRASDEIEHNLGVRPHVIAYPKGKYDVHVQESVSHICDAALGSVGITTASSMIDLYAIPRVPVHRRIKMWKFKLRTRPLFWKLQRAFGRI